MSKPKRVLPDGPITDKEYYAARDIVDGYEIQERKKEKERLERLRNLKGAKKHEMMNSAVGSKEQGDAIKKKIDELTNDKL